MHNRQSLLNDLSKTDIRREGILLIHSSMKSLGEVEGGADTVLDVFSEYMKEGLLLFPTHSWSEKSLSGGVYDVHNEPSCVGILSDLFRKRPGVLRSLHPTHSIAALGKQAESFISGEEFSITPCSRYGCWGKLLDQKAQILFLGCTLRSNTFIHGVEEWNLIDNRINPEARKIKVVRSDGRVFYQLIHGHKAPVDDVSKNYIKLKDPFLKQGAAENCHIGEAESYLCDAESMYRLTSGFLKKDPDLFLYETPVPEEWY